MVLNKMNKHMLFVLVFFSIISLARAFGALFPDFGIYLFSYRFYHLFLGLFFVLTATIFLIFTKIE